MEALEANEIHGISLLNFKLLQYHTVFTRIKAKNQVGPKTFKVLLLVLSTDQGCEDY